jgi:hypothetical protein
LLEHATRSQQTHAGELADARHRDDGDHDGIVQHVPAGDQRHHR